jgi:hypothetical protein
VTDEEVSSAVPTSTTLQSTTTVVATTTGTTQVPTTITTSSTRDKTTLYCWALMLSTGYERDLMRSIASKGASIFACEAYQVFSDGEFELCSDPKVEAKDVGDLHLTYGGPYNNALNSEIFDRTWRHVRDLGTWEDYSWTVKVDPDAVFLPMRLKQHLVKSDPMAKVYLNNCDQGLHGPIEVISLGGLQVFLPGLDDCKDALQKEWEWAGEDVWARHCWGMLKIDRVDDFKLLSEQVCFYEDPVHMGCVSGKVAFHPFKDEEAYFKCLEDTKGPIKSDVNEKAKNDAESDPNRHEYVDGEH